MKKILIGLLIILLIGLLAFNITLGFNKYFEDLEVYNIYQLMEESEKMEKEIETTETQKKVNYPRAISNLNGSYDAFVAERQKYQDKLEVSTYVYKVEKLFVKLGNKATEEGVTVKMDVTNAVEGQNMYDISFSASGSYISLIDFISSIENDSELGFKIEEFKMEPGSVATTDENGDTQNSSLRLIATFKCKDILIEDMEMQRNTEAQDNGDKDFENPEMFEEEKYEENALDEE